MRILAVLMVLFCAACATPYGDGQSSLGGSSDQRLSEDRYAITAELNGFTSPGQLKPMIVRRAKLIGMRYAFLSFEIEGAVVSYSTLNAAYSAHAVVRFSRSHESRGRGERYLVTDPDPYRTELSASDSGRLATIRSSSSRDEPTNLNFRFNPVFLDAVSAHDAFFSGELTAHVRPGRNALLAYVFASPLFMGPVALEGELEAGATYIVVGSYSNGELQVWLENEKTRTAAGTKQRVWIGRPTW